MKRDVYEVRGLKFVSRSTAMALDHLCTFSISLRLPSGSYWVAYYKWQESSSASASLTSGNLKVIATGAGVVPSLLYLDGGMFPKDVLDFESSGTLDYVRQKNNKFVWVKINATGKKHQILRFRMVEPSAASADEHFAMRGRVGLWQQRRARTELQTLQRSPTAEPPPPHPFFSAQ